MQGVLVFASSAARAAAITSPQEGQYSYLKDTNSTEYYDGAAWIAAPIGDITGVTAGTGISGGGTSGTVTVTNSMATEIAAKGDLIVGTGAATFDNLTVGANDTLLTADSSTATGLKWAANTQGMTLLSTTTLSGASTVVSSISQAYKNLYVIGYGFTNSTATGDLQIKINQGNGQYMNGYAGATANPPSLINPQDFIRTNATQKNPAYTNADNMFILTMYNYAQSAFANHPFQFNATFDYIGGISSYNLTGTYFAFAAISSILFSNTGGNWAGGTVKIYGVN
jgi:hypothetical protein